MSEQAQPSVGEGEEELSEAEKQIKEAREIRFVMTSSWIPVPDNRICMIYIGYMYQNL